MYLAWRSSRSFSAMDTISHRLKFLKLTWLLLLTTQGTGATSRTSHTDRGKCPSDAVERMTQCTLPLTNFQMTKDKASLTKYCRTLKQAPVCLERILHQCQGHEDLESIDGMKATIAQLKSRFDRVCEPLCGQCYENPSPNAKAVSSSGVMRYHATIFTVFSFWVVAVLAV